MNHEITNKSAANEQVERQQTSNAQVTNHQVRHQQIRHRGAANLLCDVSIFGEPRSKEDVISEMQKSPDVYDAYDKLLLNMQTEFLEFCMGVRGVNITYDPVFKKIFNPETHPERLEDFLSCCLGQNVKVVQALPNESERLTEDGSLLVMDILVKLQSGALVNVEIQRMGYLFPGPRCACYSSDLMMRQYSEARARTKLEGNRFNYHEIKPVYTIVLIEKSTEEFHRLPNDYLHYAKQTFNTGLAVDLLQEYLLIPLDILRGIHQNISNKLDAWLYFIASDSPKDIQRVIKAYPEFEDIYREVFQFRYQVKELILMYSEGLKILDANTVEYMVEQQQEKIEKKDNTIKTAVNNLRKSGSTVEQIAAIFGETVAEIKGILNE